MTDFRIEAFRGRQGLPAGEAPAIALEDCAEGTIVDARGTAGAQRLVHVAGAATRDLVIRGARLAEAGEIATFADASLRPRVRVE